MLEGLSILKAEGVFGCQDTLTRTSSLALEIIFCRSSAELCRLEPPLTCGEWHAKMLEETRVPNYPFPNRDDASN